jgi:retinol dehydrogenase 14
MTTDSAGAGPLSGRTAVITGATSGIGREIAGGLARLGASTLLVGRGAERVAAVAAAIEKETGIPAMAPIAVRDLAERGEMVRVADEIARCCPKLHILVNNAGGIFVRRERTTDGLERTFALNVLAPFVLTERLAGRLRESAPARVVQVASAAHRGQHLEWNDLQTAERYSGWRAYGRSKLALLLLTREFARRWAGTGVTVNAVHPGFVRSGFGQNTPGGTAVAIRVAARLFGRTPRRGAEVAVYAASDPGLETVTGAYFSDHRAAPGSRASRDAASARRLYEACAEIATTPPPLRTTATAPV